MDWLFTYIKKKIFKEEKVKQILNYDHNKSLNIREHISKQNML